MQKRRALNVGDFIGIVGVAMIVSSPVLLVTSFWQGWQFAATATVALGIGLLVMFLGIEVSDGIDRRIGFED